MKRLLALDLDLLPYERVDVVEVAWFGYGVVVAAVR
jgi:hypothetical protein